MRLCKDCRWSRRGWFATLMDVTVGMECAHPVAGVNPLRIDPVDGKLEGGGNQFCSVNRMHSSDHCGYAGGLWEARK